MLIIIYLAELIADASFVDPETDLYMYGLRKAVLTFIDKIVDNEQVLPHRSKSGDSTGTMGTRMVRVKVPNRVTKQHVDGCRHGRRDGADDAAV